MISAEVTRRAKRGDRDARDHVLVRALRFIQEDQYCSDLADRVRDEFADLSQEFAFRLETRVSSWWENNYQLWLRKWWRQHVFDASRKSSLDTVPIDLDEEDDKDLPRVQERKITDYRRMEDSLARRCDRAQVYDSLNVLSEGQRTVLKMRLKGLKNHEIAEELDISESAVSSRIRRAKNNRELRETLKILLDVRR
jgi:RNA polymerase sigma factor (sigma-70 family)